MRLQNKIAILTIWVCMMFVAVGCSPTYVAQQPMQQPQQVMASTCTNAQGMVVEDQWCDSNYIAQQRQIAIQQNNQALLNSLLLYHMIYSTNPYRVGVYVGNSGYYNSAPRGYVIQRRSTYVTNVTNHTINVSNGRATTVVNKSTQPSSRQYTPSAQKPTTSQPSRSYSAPSRSYSAPSRSYSSPSRSSSSSSSSSRRR